MFGHQEVVEENLANVTSGEAVIRIPRRCKVQCLTSVELITLDANHFNRCKFFLSDLGFSLES